MAAVLYAPFLRSDLSLSIENQFDLVPEEVKIALIDWYQIQGLDTVLCMCSGSPRLTGHIHLPSQIPTPEGFKLHIVCYGLMNLWSCMSSYSYFWMKGTVGTIYWTLCVFQMFQNIMTLAELRKSCQKTIRKDLVPTCGVILRGLFNGKNFVNLSVSNFSIRLRMYSLSMRRSISYLHTFYDGKSMEKRDIRELST